MKNRYFAVYALLVIAFLVLLVINLLAGSVDISIGKLWQILYTQDRVSVDGKIIWEIRMPRIIASIFLGGALALSGYLLQKFFSNPIAGPFVLGISSGAKLVVAILMVAASRVGFGIHSYMMVLAAFCGSLVATAVVLAAAKRVRNMSVLIVCGVMIGYIGSAITELIVTFAADSNIVNLHNWSLGSFSGISWGNVYCFVPIVVLAGGFSFFLAKGIEAYSYGEDYARSLGMRVNGFRLVLIMTSSVLSATVTAFAGPISFVGIAVPHVIHLLAKTQKPKVILPATFLGGATFCLLADVLARCLFAPTELSISTVTAVFGAPVVISMLLKRRMTNV